MPRSHVLLINEKKQIVFSDVPGVLEKKIMGYLENGECPCRFEMGKQSFLIEKSIQGSQTLFKIYPQEFSDKNQILFQFFQAAFEQSYDGVIITDSNGKVVYLNENYEKFLQLDRNTSIGKHVTEIIPNSRMHIVAENKKPEIGKVWKFNNKTLIVSRFPLFHEGNLIGTIGFILFQNSLELRDLLKKLEDMEKKLEYYKNNIFPSYRVKYSFEDIFTQSPKMQGILEKAKKIASTPSNVVITGESGTGKELLAHSVHHYSYRKEGPFITVNCSAIPHDLFESELFGYSEGAFTGAKKGGKPGKFEAAHNGTIFLDEIAEMPLNVQVKLLRVIQERELERIGSNQRVFVDVRIVAATNKNLLAMVEKGLFREDLYYRLNVFNIHLPPLRERREDIPGIIQFFLHTLEKEMGRKISIEQEALELLKTFTWPGNIRELKNLIEMLTGLMDGNIITKENLPVYFFNQPQERLPKASRPFQLDEGMGYKDTIQRLEKELILTALKNSGGCKKKASKALGIARSLLYNKLKEFSIDPCDSQINV